jgi:hypothetical protein
LLEFSPTEPGANLRSMVHKQVLRGYATSVMLWRPSDGQH